MEPIPNVEIKEVDESNWKNVIALAVKDEQKDFIATNLFSIAQSKIFDNHFNLVIYHEGISVGYILYASYADLSNQVPGKYKDANNLYTEIVRFMIDEKYQRKGIGFSALVHLIEYLSSEHNIGKICMSYLQENDASGRLFRKAGFTDLEQSEKEIALEYNYNI